MINNDDEVQNIGNKAYNLKLLDKAGVKVPKWVCLSDYICRKISRLEKLDMIVSIIKDYLNVIENDMGYPVIVRSSSTSEDCDKQSNAGKYLSIYNIKDREGLIEAVINCWKSKDETANMGILIQIQLNSFYSGVAFIYEEDGNIKLLIEAGIGLGEMLVSGYISPLRIEYNYSLDQFRILQNSKQRIAEFLIDSKYNPTDDIIIRNRKFHIINQNDSVMYVCFWNDVDYWEDFNNVLEELRDECLKIYQLYGDSDIEWASTEEDELYILQRRPITHNVNNQEVNGDITTGTSIVGGRAIGKLVMLNEFHEGIDCIVFSPVILPNHFNIISRCKGILTTENSLLSHVSILAREYNIPYWAGVTESLIDKFHNQVVVVDFTKRDILTAEEGFTADITEEYNMKNSLNLDNGRVYDIITWMLLKDEEKKEHRLEEKTLELLRRYYGDRTVKKLMERNVYE